MPAFTHPFDFLVASATRLPSSVAISTVDVNMTYEELLDTSLRFAALLRERGVKPGDVVGVRAPGLVELSLAFAIFHEAAVGTNVPTGYLEAGGTAIDWVVTLAPLDSFPIDRHIVLDAATMERVATLTLGDDAMPYPSDHAVCRLPFSSGTTGRPKPVPLTIDTLVDRCIDRRNQWMPAILAASSCEVSPAGYRPCELRRSFPRPETFALPPTRFARATRVTPFTGGTSRARNRPKHRGRLLRGVTAVDEVVRAGEKTGAV